MPTNPRMPTGTNESYDDFEAAFKAARIPTQLYEALGDVWVDSPARAHHLIARFKDRGQTLAMKFKDAPLDEFDQLGQEFTRLLRARALAPGGDKSSEVKGARAYLAQLSGQRPHGDGTLSDIEKSRTTGKAAQPRSLDDLLAGGVRSRQADADVVAVQTAALERKRT